MKIMSTWQYRERQDGLYVFLLDHILTKQKKQQCVGYKRGSFIQGLFGAC